MKSRLTITLDKDLLKRIDTLIDKKTIRNRSHAIESLISETLAQRIKYAVILAGGRKNKKCVSLRNINGRTLLHYQIDHLKHYGIKRIIICAGKFGKDIKKQFGDGAQLGVSISYISEPQSLGTAGAVCAAKKFTKDHKFLVLHGDVLTDIDLLRLFEFHKTESTIATIAVKPRLAERRFGKVLIAGNKITHFLEDEGKGGISIVNAGVYIFEPDIFGYFPKKEPSYFEKDIFPQLARSRDLSAYIFQGKWYEVSRYKDYIYAKKKWAKIN